MVCARALNVKATRFAHEYLKDFNAGQAAVRAGYAKSSSRSKGCHLLQDQRVQDIIQKKAKDHLERIDVDAAYVLAGAKEVYIRCMNAEPVRDKDGNESGQWKFDSSGATKALKLMGDHVAVNAFKGEDDNGNPIDQNWVVTFVDATPNDTKKT